MALGCVARIDWKNMARRVALVALGAAILTFGIHNIHQVVGITEGGAIGAVLLAGHWLGIPASVASPFVDIACYALAFRLLGGRFLGWSALSTALVSIFYALWEHLPYLLPDLSSHPLIAAVLGGSMVGLGVGLVVRQGASSGGDDALALSIERMTGWRLSMCYLVTDLVVLGLSLSYIEPQRIAFSLITVCVSSPVIDWVSCVRLRRRPSRHAEAVEM